MSIIHLLTMPNEISLIWPLKTFFSNVFANISSTCYVLDFLMNSRNVEENQMCSFFPRSSLPVTVSNEFRNQDLRKKYRNEGRAENICISVRKQLTYITFDQWFPIVRICPDSHLLDLLFYCVISACMNYSCQ